MHLLRPSDFLCRCDRERSPKHYRMKVSGTVSDQSELGSDCASGTDKLSSNRLDLGVAPAGRPFILCTIFAAPQAGSVEHRLTSQRPRAHLRGSFSSSNFNTFCETLRKTEMFSLRFAAAMPPPNQIRCKVSHRPIG